MKTKLLYLLFAGALFFGNVTIAQTALSPGDIVVFWNQTDTPDDFAFVTFVDLEPGTVIYFTDCGADALGFNNPCSEGARAYTVPIGGKAIGDIVRYDAGTNSDFTTYTDSVITGSLATSTSGDQIIVFQDAANAGGSANAAANPAYIFASNTSANTFVGDKTDSNQTGMPAGLQDTTAPVTALGLGAGPIPQDEVDNAVYNGTYVFTTAAEAQLALTDPSNYVSSSGITVVAYADAVAAIPGKLTITTLSTTEVEAQEIVMYPNPASSFITIAGNEEVVDEVRIYNVIGKEVLRANLVNDKINISALSSGMYIVNLIGDNVNVVKKLVKE